MCKEAYQWYKESFNKEVIDYEKLKKTYKDLKALQCEKESEN